MLAIRRKRYIAAKAGIKTVVLTMALATSIWFGVVGIKAAEPRTWMNPRSVTAEPASFDDMARECDEQTVPAVVSGLDKDVYKNQRTHNYKGCITEGKDVSLAVFSGSNGNRRWAIKARSDKYYRAIVGASENERLRLMPGTNRLVYMSYTGNYAYATITTIENALTDLRAESIDGSGYVDQYVLNDAKAKKWLEYDYDGRVVNMAAYSTAFSPNGRFMIAWISYKGYVKIDFESGRVTEIGRFPGAWYGGDIYNPVAAAISSDGRYAFIHDGPTVVDTENCGREVTRELINSGRLFDGQAPECRKTQLYQWVADYVGYNGYGSYYRWNYDESALEFFVQPFPHVFNRQESKKVTIWLDRESESKLDYLALGDSFSSGEGDYLGDSGNRHLLYLSGTDEDGPPREKCHISKRSYPFLLRERYGLDSYSMKSVACSGAMTKDVAGYFSWLPQKSDDYDGQGDRLKGVAQKEQYQQSALEGFTPGRVRQIEFVKKYKPRAITITAGGNDVGFATTISECVQAALDECEAAVSDGAVRRRLARSMNRSFITLRNLYINLRNASSSSSIYVIGYPLIINDDEVLAGLGKPCALNAGYASLKERILINEATRYMNDVIEAAARSAGVKYIDVERALDGGRLCEGVFTGYVTGVADQFGRTGSSDELKSFIYHPNVVGHRMMAQKIQSAIGESITKHKRALPDPKVQVPDYPQYFDGAGESEGTTYVEGDNVIIISPSQGDKLSIGFDEGTYGKTTIKLSMFSDPIDLGSVEANSDGSLQYTLQIPDNISVGYHTVVFSGTTFSGEPLEIAKRIFVKGKDPGDIDADGIDDVNDACLFVAPSKIDYDHDGIDDACDKEILQRADLDSTEEVGAEREERRYIAAATIAAAQAGRKETEAQSAIGAYVPSASTTPGLSSVDRELADAYNYDWIIIFALSVAGAIVLIMIKLKINRTKRD